MKAFLDHFAYYWMPHRPAPEMFEKRAVIITQCLGSGAKSAAKDVKHSLSWWGILITKFKFFVCCMMQKSIHKSDPEYLDGKYWAEQGWLDSGRPWK